MAETFDPSTSRLKSKEVNNNDRTDGNHQTDDVVFYYLNDNHTSVVGMREIFKMRGYRSRCLSNDSFEYILHSPTPSNLSKLMAYPVQSNFSGYRYPLEWGDCSADGVVNLLDAASFVSSALLDLSQHHPHLIALSMYKIFGFPTGIG